MSCKVLTAEIVQAGGKASVVSWVSPTPKTPAIDAPLDEDALIRSLSCNPSMSCGVVCRVALSQEW